MRLKKLLDIIESEILAELQNISLHEARGDDDEGEDDRDDDGKDDSGASTRKAPKGIKLDMRKGKGARGGTRTSAGTVGKIHGREIGKKGSDGFKDREKLGDKMLADPKVVAKFKAKGLDGEELKSAIWASASDTVARKKHGGERRGGKPKKKVDTPTPEAPTGKSKKLGFKSKGYKKPVAKKAKQSKDPEQTSLDLK